MGMAGAGLPRFGQAESPLVGREREVAELAGLMPGNPLITVTGPGGVGKTRLAVEVARSLTAEFPDGMFFIGLGGVADGARVPAEVAAALGVQPARGAGPGAALVTALARQRLLLILDNCEQVALAVAGLTTELLETADDLRILATSREQLWVEGEVRYRLSPLSLPGAGGPGETGRAAAVTLFAERARLADDRFALTPATAPLAARVVTRLDGMPLAIELAAAQVEGLGLAGLADRIDDALPLLASGAAETPRHQSLAAVAEWSYRLLPGSAQRVFRWLAVFPGPFTLEAAQAVAGPAAGAAVVKLVDCSLVSPPQSGPDGRLRYSLLQTLRDYGLTRLAGAGEEEPARAALAAFALPVAEQAAAGLDTSDGRELAALRWLDAEEATLGAALDWTLDHDPERALRLAIALAPWWIIRGRLTEGYSRLTAAVQARSAGEAAADAQQWLGYLASSLGNYADSEAHYTAAWETAGDPLSRTAILGLAGRYMARSNLGQFAEGTDDAQRALALARQSGDRVALVRALGTLSTVAWLQDSEADALTWIQQAVDNLTADVPGHLARRCRRQQANALIVLGEYAAARQVCAAELAWCRDAGDLISLAGLLETSAYLEDLAASTGPLAAYLHETVTVAGRIGHTQKNYLDLGANLCAQTGRWADAVTLWGAYDAEAERTGTHGLVLPGEIRRRDEYLRQAETALGPERLREAQDRGTRLSYAAALEFVTMLTAPAQAAAPASSELTARERELVTLVAQGRTNAQIAGQLFISVRTVASHLDRIRAKTGARRRADLTRLALQENLV